MMSRCACLAWICFVLLPCAAAENLSLHGYFIETPLIWNPRLPPDSGSDWRLDNLWHARQNLRAYPHRNLTAALELKTRMFWGESAADLRRSGEIYGAGLTYFDWRRDFISKERIVLTGSVDRLWLNWTLGALDLTAGRQRIAWGTNLVWNVVDLFNPRSPLDFDNVEMPGADAVRMQIHTSPISALEIAFAPQQDPGNAVAAALGSFHLGGYDLYLLGGRDRGRTALGFAWSGQIRTGGFRGEGLLRLPDADTESSARQFACALSGDFTFRNSLYLHAECLYNSLGTAAKAGGFALQQSLMNGWLSPARWSLFGEIAKELHPLVRGGIAGILNPDDASRYFSPSLTWSAATNLDCTFLALIFGGESGTEFGDYGDMIMARLQWSY
jgi:hypothetical protein